MRYWLTRFYTHVAKLFAGHNISRFRIVRKLHDMITTLLKTNFVELDGHKIYLNSNDMMSAAILVNQKYEPFETEVVKREIKKGDVVIDIGANIGYYTLMFARLVGETGKVFAFEPDPTNFKLLKKNVEVNGYTNVILFQKAVSDSNRKLKLYLSDKNKGDHRTFASNEERDFVEVAAIRLDDAKEIDKKVNFIKMDIQGSEGSALNSMKKLIKRNRRIKILTEFEPNLLRQAGSTPGDYLNSLKELGFKIYNLDENGKKIEQADNSKLLLKYVSNKDAHTNLLCIKMLS